MNYILYPHGGSADHGYEARLRCMLRLLPGSSLEVYSDAPEEDLSYWPHPVFSLRPVPYRPSSEPSLLLAYQGDDPQLFPQSCSHPCQLLLGAAPLPSLDTSENRALFSHYRRLIAYDSASAAELRGLHPDVCFCPDPLFSMYMPSVPVPVSDPYLVLSVSPSEESPLLLDSLVQFLSLLLSTTDFRLFLIPFVCHPGSQNQTLLQSLARLYPDTERLRVLPECSSVQLQLLMKNADFTITSFPAQALLSYAALTPTLLLHSSVRAQRIASGLFGNTRCHVLPPAHIQDSRSLIRAFHTLRSDSGRLRRILQQEMPHYRSESLKLPQLITAPYKKGPDF